MFRCITTLKGLVIDIDSFSDIELCEWSDIVNKYKCLFLTSDDNTKDELEELYGGESIYKMEKFVKLFAPSPTTHQKVLQKLGLNGTEIAYISTKIIFLKNAMNFMGGTIWVTNEIIYNNASSAPDLICKTFLSLKKSLDKGIEGFLGEVAIYPSSQNRGMIIPVVFETEEEQWPLYMLGRYFAYSHYMNQLHPYSTAIYLNKKVGKSYYGIFNERFSKLYTVVIKKIQSKNRIDGVCSVPVRPHKENRFEPILDYIAKECKVENVGKNFVCEKDYSTQKNLSSVERYDNVKDVFKYHGDLAGKNIVLIDDIISTGSTISACIKELKNKGANQIYIVVLAVNQLQGIYWSADEIQVCCPRCGEKMHLYVNGRNGSFFYSCFGCNNTIDFEEGRDILCTQVIEEMIIEKEQSEEV